MEWRPIETAPKNGDWVLIYQGGQEVTLAWYCDADGPSHGVWFDQRDNGYSPTHWMPLPDPPKV